MQARKTRRATMLGDISLELQRVLASQNTGGFKRYHHDPVGFCRDVLGFDPWSRQCQVLETLDEHDAVTCPAGRAVGKSRLGAGAALWFAATRGAGSRVILTAPGYRQIQLILWEEIKNLWRSAAVPFRGDCGKMASTGIRFSSGAQIVGFTAEDPVSFQGVRAPEMLVIADEASGIPDEIYHAIEGNMAGGAKLLLLGNPTRARGYFRESIRSPRFRAIQISAEESPNVISGQTVVKGLANAEWVQARREEWGEDSPLYKIHVRGEVVEAEEGRLFSTELIAGAEAAWASAHASGRLVIGLDPAGSGGEGDESAFVARRGKKVLRIQARRGLTEDAHIVEVLGLIATLRGDSVDTALVVVDRDGWVGARVYAALSAYRMTNEGAFQLYGVRGGERARRKPLTYDRVRDEVWFGLVDAMRDGLVIPEDLKLSRELAEVRAEVHISGRSKVTGKDELRRALGRSPDRADALCLSCVEVTDWDADRRTSESLERNAAVQHDPYRSPQERGIDPYSAMNAWGRRG